MSSLPKTLKGFAWHGVEFDEEVGGDNWRARCPFCDKNKHFFANEKNKLFDCKSCGVRGNFEKFLELIAARNVTMMTSKALRKLSKDRKLPEEAFKLWDIGWDGKHYTIPTYNFQGKVVDVRSWKPDSNRGVMSTPGAHVGLLGGKQIGKRIEEKVYVCEGEWDTLALDWLLRKLGKNGVVVGVPGASTFKQEWIGYFSGREVQLLYDRDEAGDRGEALALERLTGTASSIGFLHWPDKLPKGYDVRDFIARQAVEKGQPKTAYKKLKSLFAKEPRKGPETSPGAGGGPNTAVKKPVYKPISNRRLYKTYRKWLKMKDINAIRMIFGTIQANKLEGDPVWLFLVAPPGGSKSELIMSLSSHPMIESTTSLTPHSLVSGASWNDGRDPSLIPLLNNRILAIKDFTTILTMNQGNRDEVLGILRDAYDGKTEKIFGTGIKRSYTSKFGIIAGVTNKIEAFGVIHQSLGERFIKVRIAGDRSAITEEEKIRKAISNINSENKMRRELQDAAARAIARPLPKRLPRIPESVTTRIVALSQYSAALRGVVDRDRFNGQVQYKPMIEVGTRLAKQYMKTCIGISIHDGLDEVTEEIYGVVRQTALDTTPDRNEEILKQLWKATRRHKDDSLSTKQVSEKTHLPQATVFRVLEDLKLLRVVRRHGSGSKFQWAIHKRIRKLIKVGEIYPKH